MLRFTAPAPTDLKYGVSRIRREINELEKILKMRRQEKLCRDIKYQLAAARFEVALIRHAHICRKAGFDPDQPRVPAGSREGGQWTAEGAGDDPAPAGTDNIQLAAQSVQFCNNQLIIDNLKCNQIQPAWYRAACRSQAMERYAACLAGRPLPPLPFFGE